MLHLALSIVVSKSQATFEDFLQPRRELFNLNKRIENKLVYLNVVCFRSSKSPVCPMDRNIISEEKVNPILLPEFTSQLYPVVQWVSWATSLVLRFAAASFFNL